ncbi:hypothetical protein LSH36_371g05007 [Paralvinella palmiformis]|uniref:G-protein coupled receptors family 1 profile domain-containing protein n=1 Tax=Paralvinella palmiformis TaxID=53620 RepID=A0AAD9JDT6_9ANNE|nr:hypothetical protein LSH36_371g05007 [Paralvinella palmiformis]
MINESSNFTAAAPLDDDYRYYFDDYWNVTADHPELTRVVEFLDTYYLPTIIGIGLIGNTVSFVVFVSTYLNRLSLSVYLAALSVADAGFLCALAVGWLEYAGIALFHTNGWCQATVYATYVFSFLSAWFVVSFTVERYIAICHPLKRPEMCTVARARCVVCGLSAFALASYSCTLKFSGVKRVGPYTLCHSVDEYNGLMRALTYVDTLVTFIVPFAAIFAFNVRIFHKISYFYSKKDGGRLAADSPYEYCTTAHHRHYAATKICLRNRAQIKVTKFLLLISTVFLVINLPSYVIRIMAFLHNIMAQDNTRLDILLQQLFQFIFYTNFSINFFLYSLCSKKFRTALFRLGWQMKYKVTNFVRQSYRLLLGSSNNNTLEQDVGQQPGIEPFPK